MLCKTLKLQMQMYNLTWLRNGGMVAQLFDAYFLSYWA